MPSWKKGSLSLKGSRGEVKHAGIIGETRISMLLFLRSLLDNGIDS